MLHKRAKYSIAICPRQSATVLNMTAPNSPGTMRAMILLLLTLCWVAGMLYSRALGMQPWLAYLLISLAAGGLAAAWRWRRERIVLACVLFAALGAGRMAWATSNGAKEMLQRFNDRGTVRVEGWVCGEPSVRSRYVQIELCATSADASEGALPVSGKLLTTVPRYTGVHYGLRLAVDGRLETPAASPDFDYAEHLLARGVRSVMRYPQWEVLPGQVGSWLWRKIYTAKEQLRLSVERSLPDPEAGLLNGILLGLGHTLPDELYEGYRRTGLAHIIVISGFNISMVVQFVLALAGRVLHRWRALWLSLAAVVLYALFVGATPPVVRAAIMAGLCLLAQRLGRRAHLLTALAIASLLMSAVNPYLLWSTSFQLSFASTLALALLEPRLASAAARFEQGRRWLPLLRELLLATLAAQLATLPIIWSAFGEVSLVSLLANVLALPAQGAVMALGAPVPLVGLWSPALGRLIGLPSWVLLRWTNLVVMWLARLPWAVAAVPEVPAPALWVFYGALLGLALPRRRRLSEDDQEAGESTPQRWGNLWRYTLPVAGALLTMLLTTLPDGRLHVYTLDVGQGDAILLRSPRGRLVLIDGGPDPVLLSARLGELLPFWQRRIDLVISTHADSDHLGGLIAVTQRYRVETALAAPCGLDSALMAHWRASLQEQGSTLLVAVEGLRVAIEPDLSLLVLHPGHEAHCGAGVDLNDLSVVCLVEYGTARILLTGDVGEAVEQSLVSRHALEGITLLKAGHHGSAASTGEALLNEARPEVTALSVGRDNSYGHPAPEVLARLMAQGGRVYRTDEQGTIEFITDGERHWIKVRATLASEVAADE